MGTTDGLHRRETIITGLLSIFSVALVFAAALGYIPANFLPVAPEYIIDGIPHINVLLSLLAIITITAGWRSINRNRIRTHQRLMTIALILFATFLVLYLYRLTMIGGATEFPGPDQVYRSVYLPVLIIHISLAVICIPLLYYVVILAVTTPIETIGKTRHPTVGRVAMYLWLISFALGIVVYVILYWLY